MKKVIFISFLLIYLLSATELHQLVKLPFLVEHYLEHKEKDKLTLMQFLQMHYAEADAKAADYAKDMKLPFKSHDECISSNTGSFFIVTVYNLNIQQPVPELTPYPLYSDNFRSSVSLSSIWQPPKFC